MGVDIKAYKLRKYLGAKYNNEMLESNCKARRIFSMNFHPIHHLTKFEDGFYETEYLYSPEFSMPYSCYNDFRRKISIMVHGVNPVVIWDNIDDYVGKHFVEFINFADNEGSFDYVVADKLYKDFSEFKEKAKKDIPEYYNSYCNYMEILKAASENKGVVYYS